MKKQKILGADVRRIVRTLTMPARRHRCELCERVFVCHLCGLDDEHGIHGRRKETDLSEPVFVCQECVYYHELYVVTCSDSMGLCNK